MDKIKVLIVDDNIQYRWGLMETLITEETLEIVEEASDGDEAVEKALALRPDVVLMDLHMPNSNGVEATRRLRAEAPDINTLMNTVSEHEEDLFEALKAGARGYLLKNEKPDMIIQAIHYTAKGGMILSPLMAGKLAPEFKLQVPVAQVKASGVREELSPEPAVTPEKSAPVTAQPEPAGPVPTETPEVPVLVADLVIPPPLELSIILRLHKWLKEVAEVDVGKIVSSLTGDTVVNVTFHDPTSLGQMLAGLPYVRKVTEEPYATGTETAPDVSGKGAAGPWTGDSITEHKRFRLLLKS